jgi:hypothetical protein
MGLASRAYMEQVRRRSEGRAVCAVDIPRVVAAAQQQFDAVRDVPAVQTPVRTPPGSHVRLPWPSEDRRRPGIVIGLGCGMFSAAEIGDLVESSAHLRPELGVGISGGSLAVGMHMAGADRETLIALVGGAPLASFVQRVPGKRSFVLSDGRAYERWVHGWLEHLGHTTWGAFRRPPTEHDDRLSGWDHRFNVVLTAIRFSERDGDRLVERSARSTGPDRDEVFRAKLLATGAVHMRQVIFPREHHLLGLTAAEVDRLPVAPFIAASSAHPLAFDLVPDSRLYPHKPGRPHDWFLDGGAVGVTRLFGDAPPPLPVLVVSMGVRTQHLSRVDHMFNLIHRDARRAPFHFHHRSGPSRFGPLDLDRVQPADLLRMFSQAAARFSLEASAFSDYLDTYERWVDGGHTDFRRHARTTGIPSLRRSLLPPLVDQVREQASVRAGGLFGGGPMTFDPWSNGVSSPGQREHGMSVERFP